MIVGYRQAGGKTYLLAGLSDGNIERLTNGEPIRVSRESHGLGCPEEIVLMIVHGATEDALQRALEDQGIIRDHTQKHDLRKNQKGA